MLLLGNYLEEHNALISFQEKKFKEVESTENWVMFWKWMHDPNLP